MQLWRSLLRAAYEMGKSMIGLWTRKEFAVALGTLVLELIGLPLVLRGGNSLLVGTILVAIAATAQIAVALRFRARRKRAGTWRSNQP